ncbi:MAG: hypothetical protein HOV97_05085 [Nonomuraea sp.]|nr:hypothetical protein [Nonomuraea sp.]
MAIGRSTITAAEREFVETWENIAPFQNAIVRLDVRGDEKHEVIQGEKRQFMLTTEERMLTQSKIVEKENDPFRNGAFRPINVPEDVTIETNPNALSDEEIMEIFGASDFAWSEWMHTIDSPATLNRMIDLADEADNMTVKRLREIQLRLREVKPPTRITSNDPELQKFLDQGQNTPQGNPRERRGQGGRSSAYRDR